VVTVFAANHLALIRSFLIDSGLCTASREANCAKLFCSAHTRDPIEILRARCVAARKICLRARDISTRRARKLSLFHRNFFNFEIARAMSRDACERKKVCVSSARMCMRERIEYASAYTFH